MERETNFQLANFYSFSEKTLLPLMPIFSWNKGRKPNSVLQTLWQTQWMFTRCKLTRTPSYCNILLHSEAGRMYCVKAKLKIKLCVNSFLCISGNWSQSASWSLCQQQCVWHKSTRAIICAQHQQQGWQNRYNEWQLKHSYGLYSYSSYIQIGGVSGWTWRKTYLHYS